MAGKKTGTDHEKIDDFVQSTIALGEHKKSIFIQLGLFWLFVLAFLLSLTLITLEELQVIGMLKYRWGWVLGASGTGLLGKAIQYAIKKK